MLTIGLTGGIGSGKTTVANLFAELGTPVIDTDAISHQLSSQPDVIEQIVSEFGKKVLDDDGSLDRKQLASIVFADPGARQRLERILHPRIREQTLQQIATQPASPYTIVAVPLLFETDFHQLVDRSLVVDLPESEQIRRVKQRDGRSEQEIQHIIQQQLPRQQRLELADDIIDNSGDEQALRQLVKQLHNRYLALAR